MSPRQEIEAALAAWREAEQRLAEATGTHRESELRAEVERARAAYQHLVAEEPEYTDDPAGAKIESLQV